jgi:hypothetical protein
MLTRIFVSTRKLTFGMCETSVSPLRFMLRISSLVKCVSVLHGTCLQSVEIVFIRPYVQPCLSKNPKYKFYTITILVDLLITTGLFDTAE